MIRLFIILSIITIQSICLGNETDNQLSASKLTKYQEIETRNISSTNKIIWQQIGPGCGGGLPLIASNPLKSDTLLYFQDMGSALISEDGGKSYRGINGFDNGYFGEPGFCSSVQFSKSSPDTVFAAGIKGLFRSNNGGKAWHCITANEWPEIRYLNAVTVDPDNVNIVYCGAGLYLLPESKKFADLGVWKTCNAGKKWEKIIDGLAPVPCIRKIIIDPASSQKNRVVYLATNNGFYKSTYSSEKWIKKNSGLPHDKIRDASCSYDPATKKTVLTILLATVFVPGAGKENAKWLGGIYQSNDGGERWTEKNGNLRFDSKYLPSIFTLSQWQNSYLKGVGRKAPKGDVLQNFVEIEAHPENPDIIYAGTGSATYEAPGSTVGPFGVFKTIDGGKNWKLVTWNIKTPKNYFAYDKFWSTNFKENAESKENVNAVFYPLLNGVYSIDINRTNPDIVSFSTFDMSLRTTDGGKTWNDICTDKIQAGNVWYDNKTSDLPTIYKGRGSCNIVACDIAFDQFDSNKVYLSANDWDLFYSTDISANTFCYSGVLGTGSFILATDPVVKNVLYVGVGQSQPTILNKSCDGGRTFKKLSNPFTNKFGNVRSFFSAIIIDPFSPESNRTIYCAGNAGALNGRANHGSHASRALQGFGVSVSNDEGMTWKEINNGFGKNLNISCLVMHPVNHKILYAGVIAMRDNAAFIKGGVFMSTDGGETWRKITPDYIDNVGGIAVDTKNPDTIYVCSSNYSDFLSYSKERDTSKITGGVFKTTDSGKSWERIFMGQACTSVAVSPHNPQLVAIAIRNDGSWRLTDNSGIFISYDGGHTWTKCNTGLTESSVGLIRFHPKLNDVIWCGANSGWYHAKIEKDLH